MIQLILLCDTWHNDLHSGTPQSPQHQTESSMMFVASRGILPGKYKFEINNLLQKGFRSYKKARDFFCLEFILICFSFLWFIFAISAQSARENYYCNTQICFILLCVFILREDFQNFIIKPR